LDAVEHPDERMATYRRLKSSIDQRYPRDTFVAIADNDVIGSAVTLRSLQETIRTQGRDPRQVLVVQAGVDYPEYVTIFL
jgi:hypothetical protein